MNTFMLILHVVSATIWTGGHIVLSTVILPTVLKSKDLEKLLDFERHYEKIGLPALLIQIITGLYLSYSYLPDISLWFSFSNHISIHIGIKLILLLITMILAINANFRLIPYLSKKNNLNIFAGHIIAVTIIAVIFVVVGLSFRLALI